jgi:hypothetical protein
MFTAEIVIGSYYLHNKQLFKLVKWEREFINGVWINLFYTKEIDVIRLTDKELLVDNALTRVKVVDYKTPIIKSIYTSNKSKEEIEKLEVRKRNINKFSIKILLKIIYWLDKYKEKLLNG